MHETYRFVINELRSAWRFRWLGMGGAWLCAIAGWLVVMVMPNVYEAGARVYVDASSELRRLLGTQIVEQSVTARLDLVRQEMLGRAELDRVVVSTGLGRGAATAEERLPIVEQLQRDIMVSNTGPDGRPLTTGRPMQNAEAPDSIYGIQYQNADPAIALAVVDTLLNILVEDTYSATSEGSENVRRFLEQEERDYAARLAEAENRLAQFRRDNFDRLPSTQENYFERLQRETDELDGVRQTLALARSRRARIDQSLREGVPLVGSASATTTSSGGEPVTRNFRIQEQEARLEELLLRFTDRHPEVVAMRESITELRRLQAEELNAMLASGSGPIDPSNPVYQQLQISLNEVQAQIAELEADVASREERVERLRSRVDEVPEVEAQLAQLMRGYDVLSAQHAAIVQTLEREHLSRGAHESDGVEFVIIDPPVVGAEPVAPNRRMLMLMVLLASFGVAAGGAYALAQLRPVFQDPHMLRDTIGLPLLGTVSRTTKLGDLRGQRVDVLLLGGAAVMLVVAAAVLLVVDIGAPLRSMLGVAP
jgi:polysaccharide chain length determinant protein (PEP-CTERM system associated)